MMRRIALGACIAGLFVFCFISLMLSPLASADTKRLLQAIDEASSSCKAVSDKIFEFKELGGQEFKSSALLKEELTKLGFKVTGDLTVPADLVQGGVAKTAFKAEMMGKGPGPTITIMLEYDALKNGHSCGQSNRRFGFACCCGPGKADQRTAGKAARHRHT